MNISSRFTARMLLGASLASVVTASAAWACAPEEVSLRFVNTTHPDHPMSRYASGHLGVMHTGFSVSQLAWAWRVLQFGPGDANERQKLVETWRSEQGLETQDKDPIPLWKAAYKRTTGQDAPPVVQFGQAGESAFSNCTPSAVRGALFAIQERKAKRPNELQFFVENQARVFSACSERSAEGLLPPPNGSSAAAFDDYRYQQAAFDFYTQDYKNARQRFMAITKNKDSAWVPQARISAVRCLIRSATLKRDLPDLGQLETAEAELNEIIKDSSMRDWHAAAWQLMSFCRVRTQPEEWLQYLVQQLSMKSPQVPVLTVVQDVAWLARDHKLADSPFAQWLHSMQRPKEKGLDDALSRFKKSPNELNLVAVLQESEPSTPDAIVDVALAVPSTSPAYLHASYHGARLSLIKGKTSQALERINLLLAEKSLPLSMRNLLVNLRLPYEPSWQQLFNDAVKLQAGTDGFSSFADRSEKGALPVVYGFDREGADAVQSIPTAVLLELANTETRPALKRLLALTGFTRAVLLRQDTLALTAAKVLLPLDAALAKELQTWAIQPADRAHFEAVLLMAKLPALSPVPPVGRAIVELSPLWSSGAMEINGWCGVASVGGDQRAPYPTLTHRFVQPTTEVSEGPKQEFNGLRALPAAPAYFAQETLAWATANPADERAPEGLAAAVRASRWGCRMGGQPDVQRAFQLLQKKYGKTAWAQKTEQYW